MKTRLKSIGMVVVSIVALQVSSHAAFNLDNFFGELKQKVSNAMKRHGKQIVDKLKAKLGSQHHKTIDDAHAEINIKHGLDESADDSQSSPPSNNSDEQNDDTSQQTDGGSDTDAASNSNDTE
jgi:hypothetical protein